MSREGFWKLVLYLHRHCEVTSVLGRAFSVEEASAELEASSLPITDDEFVTKVLPLIDRWGVGPPEGGLPSLDTTGDGVVSLGELSAWACAIRTRAVARCVTPAAAWRPASPMLLSSACHPNENDCAQLYGSKAQPFALHIPVRWLLTFSNLASLYSLAAMLRPRASCSAVK